MDVAAVSSATANSAAIKMRRFVIVFTSLLPDVVSTVRPPGRQRQSSDPRLRTNGELPRELSVCFLPSVERDAPRS
jgi:hypothetical protein